jgi:hypothetical protein
MEENFFSAAILVAHLSEPGFVGQITYDAISQGNPLTGYGPKGVEIFGSGTRNPFGMIFHSNGNLYCSVNGPNLTYVGFIWASCYSRAQFCFLTYYRLSLCYLRGKCLLDVEYVVV